MRNILVMSAVALAMPTTWGILLAHKLGFINELIVGLLLVCMIVTLCCATIKACAKIYNLMKTMKEVNGHE